MYDAAIIGLGPAGATAARLLGNDLSVIALDKKQRAGEKGFRKPCGGLLATDAQKALARFGLTLPVDVLVNPQIFSVRTVDVKSEKIRHYQRFYLNLDRHKFDCWLKSLIPEHVEVHDGASCSAVEPCKGGYRIHWREQGKTCSAEARKLIGADGASSLVRRTFFPRSPIRRYTSIQQWFPDRHMAPFYSCIFDEDLTDCYAWGLSKEEHFIFGGAFAPHNARKNFEALKQKLRKFGFRLENPIKTEACQVLRPAGLRDFCCGGEDIFLIGEAAGFISPSSLEGISYALRSASKLSRVFRMPNPGKQYRRSTLNMRLQLFAKCLKSPFLYHPPLRRMVMASGMNSISLISEQGAVSKYIF